MSGIPSANLKDAGSGSENILGSTPPVQIISWKSAEKRENRVVIMNIATTETVINRWKKWKTFRRCTLAEIRRCSWLFRLFLLCGTRWTAPASSPAAAPGMLANHSPLPDSTLLGVSRQSSAGIVPVNNPDCGRNRWGHSHCVTLTRLELLQYCAHVLHARKANNADAFYWMVVGAGSRGRGASAATSAAGLTSRLRVHCSLFFRSLDIRGGKVNIGFSLRLNGGSYVVPGVDWDDWRAGPTARHFSI